jgi:hypothetical protein
MTTLGSDLLRDQRAIFERLADLERSAPGDVDIIVGAITSHLRSWRPVSVAPLGVLPQPTACIRDPRD